MHRRPPRPSLEQPFYGAPGFAARQPYGNDLYQVDPAPPVYGEPVGEPGYSQGPAEFEAAPFHAEAADPFNTQFPAGDAAHDEFYDDVPPNRRRIGIIAIAGVFALAVIGTAGAFGYRAIFGSSSSSSGPPPVIKADVTPSKIVPAAASKDAQANKLITDRVNDRGQGEKLVSREEQPVAVTPANSGNAGARPAQTLPCRSLAPALSGAVSPSACAPSSSIRTAPRYRSRCPIRMPRKRRRRLASAMRPRRRHNASQPRRSLSRSAHNKRQPRRRRVRSPPLPRRAAPTAGGSRAACGRQCAALAEPE